MTYDLAIVGSGIVGLAHAVAAVRRGLRVIVVEREARPIGASIRNFGFVTITGQRRGETWRRAIRSAEVWAEIAPRAAIAIEQQGLFVAARRPEAEAVLEAFMATEMGEGCKLLAPAAAQARLGGVRPDNLCAMLESSRELRVESRTAIPRLIAWLQHLGVAFRFGCAVRNIAAPQVETAQGDILAEAIVVCPGDDLATLYPDLIAERNVTRCILQMLRTEAPAEPLRTPIMSDLSLVRYRGYADLAESAPLKARLAREQPAHLEHGVHLIVVASEDGSLVVGDSHHYAPSPEPFAAHCVEHLILEEMRATLGFAPLVRERWVGTYASAGEDMFRAAPDPQTRLVMVTSGNGASTAFAIAEETLAELFGAQFGAPLP